MAGKYISAVQCGVPRRLKPRSGARSSPTAEASGPGPASSAAWQRQQGEAGTRQEHVS